ncbi:MAG: electron transfer flavoprotein beta subunit [Halothiobacillaceae bacterium]|nr:MAG: electron transfer flavoprotein beta subunit [Halothiobacillaceae bacterium]
MKERGHAQEVVVVSLGTAAVQEVLRHALAMGADRAILVESDVQLQPLGVAKLLKAVVEREQPDLILLGKQAIDSDAGQAGQMLAALLGVGQGVAVSALEVHGREIHVIREIDGGTETLALRLPAVVSVDLRLNEPRYVKLPNLMMAKKRTIETLSATELGVDASPRLQQINVANPPTRKAGIKVSSVQELVARLRNEAKVIG